MRCDRLLPGSEVSEIACMFYPPHRSGLSFLRVMAPSVGPGNRTAIRVEVQNLGLEMSRNVTVALADPCEKSSAGIVMRNLGDLTVGGLAEAELALGYAITDSIRLAALSVAVFPRHAPIPG